MERRRRSGTHGLVRIQNNCLIHLEIINLMRQTELKLPVKQTDPNQPQLSDTESQDKEITQDYVPHQPSTWLLRLLFALAKEVHRVSAHLIDRSVVEYLVAQVTSLLFNQLTGFIVAKQQQTIPKEALVQVLSTCKSQTSKLLTVTSSFNSSGSIQSFCLNYWQAELYRLHYFEKER